MNNSLLADNIKGLNILEDLIIYGLAILGVYHLIFRYNHARKLHFVSKNSVKNSTNQLRFVMEASFYKKKLMNPGEFNVFRVIENQLKRNHKGYRVLAQVSLGEILGSSCNRAFSSINSKRADAMILGPYGDPVAVVEYQGSGHNQGNAAARDAVKREALRKAGVGFIEVYPRQSKEALERAVTEVIGSNCF